MSVCVGVAGSEYQRLGIEQARILYDMIPKNCRRILQSFSLVKGKQALSGVDQVLRTRDDRYIYLWKKHVQLHAMTP